MVKIVIKESGRNLEDFLKKSGMPHFFNPDNALELRYESLTCS
jgi:hypothetical protein